MRRLLLIFTFLLTSVSTANAQGIIPIKPFSAYGLIIICKDKKSCQKDYAKMGLGEVRFIDRSSKLAEVISLSFDDMDIKAVEVYKSYIVSNLSEYSTEQIISYTRKNNTVKLQPPNFPNISFGQKLVRPLNISGFVILFKEECPACVDMKPIIEPICKEDWVVIWDIGRQKTDLNCQKVEAGKLYKTYNLKYSPTFLYLNEGQVVWSWTGFNKNLHKISLDLRLLTY